MNTHTPGPWNVKFESICSATDKPRSFSVWCGSGHVADLNTIDERGHADARLIASAPDLLAALQEAIAAVNAFEDYCSQFEHHGSSPRLGKWKEQARLAINKATSL